MALVSANEVHEGMTVHVDGKVCKVVSAIPHGTGKTGRMMHIALKTIPEGSFIEKKLGPTDKVENVSLEHRAMEYQYKDEDFFYFYDETSFEQVPIAKAVVGDAAAFLKEGAKIKIEFLNENPVYIEFPKIVEMIVSSCVPGSKGEGDATFKEAVLENGQTMLVPQFIKEGDTIRVDTVKNKYMDRVGKEDKKKPDQQQKRGAIPEEE